MKEEEEEEIKRMLKRKGVQMMGIDTGLISEEQIDRIIHMVCEEQEKKNEEE